MLRNKLRRIRERKHTELRSLWSSRSAQPAVERERGVFEREEVLEAWVEQAAHLATLGLLVPDSTLAGWMEESSSVVFEGAQGVLLDERWGFHPFTTWSCCTAANALELIAEWRQDANVTRLGVLRSYAVRHGAGPLPTETETLRPARTEHNARNEWQGAVRYGCFDAVLARYALEAVGGVDALAVTHLDALEPPRPWALCSAYQGELAAGDGDLVAHGDEAGLITRLAWSHSSSLERQERLTELLERSRPRLEHCEPQERAVLNRIEQLLERSVDLASHGPRAEDVRLRGASIG